MISTIKALADICKKEPIALGRQMENNYRQIIFDCSGFSEPITDITLVHQRSMDTAPYIVTSTTETPLVWTIDSEDTAYYGYGKGEIRISFASGLAKSVVFQTVVIKSITADTEIPEPLQSWYDQMIDYINDHSVTDDQLAQAIADYIEEHPITAPVQSVNGQIGDVVITAASLGALTSESDPVFQASPAAGITAQDITDWNNKSDFSGSYTDLTNKPTIPTKTSDLVNDSGYITSAPVTSVDGKTGAVQIMPGGGSVGQVLTKTSSGTAWQTVSGGGAVDSVNGQTGVVVLDAADVGALPDTTVIPTKTSDLTNDSGFITSADDVFWCTYGTTTSAEIEAALTAGKIPMVMYQDYAYTLRYRNSTTNHRFVCNYGGKEKSIACQSGTWIPNGDLTFLTTSYTAPVTSVNGQTGTVVLDADDVGALPDTTTAADLGAYVKPSGGIPKTDLASAVQTSLGKADTALQTAPVTSVNGQTGAVTLSIPDEVADLSDAADYQKVIEVITKTSSDTSATLVADKFYVWPEMSSLTVTVTAAGMYAFRFTSGTTPTTLTVTGATMPDSFAVEASKVYEVNVYQGYAAVQSWAA